MPNRLLRAVLIAALAVMPLCLMTGVFLSHDVLPKTIVALASATALLFLAPHWTGGMRLLWREPRGRLFLILVMAWGVSLPLSTLFSVQPVLSLVGTVWRRLGLVEQAAGLAIATAAAAFVAIDPRRRSALLRAVSISGGIASVYAIAQYFGVDPFLDPKLYTIEVFGGIVRPPATMGHAIYLASWLAPVAAVAAGLAVSETGRAWKRVHAAIAALASAAILLSGTRGAMLGLLAGMAVLTLRSPASRVLGRRLALAAAGMAAVAALLVFSPAGENLRHRLYQWKQDPGGPRTGVWLESAGLLREHPLLGAGPETFAGEFRRIESVSLSRAYPDFYHETPHNAFLDAAAAQGFPGLLILACVFGVGWTGRARPGGSGAGLEAALAAIAICGLFASFTLVQFICLWTFAGISASSRRLDNAVSDPAVSPAPAPAWTTIPATLLGGMFVVFAVALAVPDAWDARLLDAVEQKDSADAFDMFDKAERWSFALPGYELWRSREMAVLGRSLGNTPDAARAWRKAAEAAAAADIRSEERFSAAFQCSILDITTGDLTGAEAKAREAIALAPNWYKPHLLRGQILNAMGRTGEGRAELERAAALGAIPKHG